MTHPAVAQAVAFAVPHPKLGEDVAAVIVLREGAQAEERELRAFAAGSLADFKVPRTILFRDEIPKGATGKLQRIGLAEKLGLAPVKICIVGAGAIGAYFGLELALGGAEVSLIARGPHLAAMQAGGVRVRAGAEERRAEVRATDDPAELGPQDAVVITLKAHSVPGICAAPRNPCSGPRPSSSPRPTAFPGGTSTGWRGRTRGAASPPWTPAASSGRPSGRSVRSVASSTLPARSSSPASSRSRPT